MQNIVRHGVYVHKSKLYRVIGMARDVRKPNELQVIYEQLYESRLRDDKNIKLPIGTMWIRDAADFETKFAHDFLPGTVWIRDATAHDFLPEK